MGLWEDNIAGCTRQGKQLTRLPLPLPLPFPFLSARTCPACPHRERYITTCAMAARDAIEAGFDGVEILDGNGYIIDQFLQELHN